MALTAPPVIPQITDPATFATRSQDWVVWQSESFYPFLEDGASLIGLSTSGTSTTSNTIGTGSKSFTTQTGKGFFAGMSLSIARTSDTANRMLVRVDSYNSGTGALVVTSQVPEGSGTFTDWSIAIAVNAIVGTSQIADNAVTTAKLAPDVESLLASEIKSFTAVANTPANSVTITSPAGSTQFRSTTLNNGTPVTRTKLSPITLVISSGSTLGALNNVASRIAVLEIDNAGTIELAAVNLAGGTQLDETNLISTTAEGGAGGADSATTIYSTTARTNVAYRVIGYYNETQTTAGTHSAALTQVQGVGGEAFTALSSIGYGQTWQNLTGSRAVGTTYYNTTGRPIQLRLSFSHASSGTELLIVNGVTLALSTATTGGAFSTGSFVIPPGASYSVTTGAGYSSINNWAELR